MVFIFLAMCNIIPFIVIDYGFETFDRQAQFTRACLIYSIISLFLHFVNSIFAKSLLIIFVTFDSLDRGRMRDMQRA